MILATPLISQPLWTVIGSFRNDPHDPSLTSTLRMLPLGFGCFCCQIIFRIYNELFAFGDDLYCSHVN